MRFIIAILILGICILFHEFGHFLFARLNRITVLEFALGMGPTILKHKSKKSGTVYALKLLPFGGSCSMLGEDEEDTQPGSFLSKNVWQRISVVAAGPLFNFVLAFFCSVIVVAISGIDPARVTEVEKGSPADLAGLQSGDLITKYEGHSIVSGRDLYSDMVLDGIPTDEISITGKRGEEVYHLSYPPETTEHYLLGFSYDAEGEAVVLRSLVPDSPMAEAGMQEGDTLIAMNEVKITTAKSLQDYLSAHPLDDQPVDITYLRNGKEETAYKVLPAFSKEAETGFAFNLAREKTNFIGTIKGSVSEIRYWIHVTFQSLQKLFTGKVSVNQLSGPVGVVTTIGSVYSEAAAEGARALFLSMLNMLILITANLGIMNLLPLPALDGGRIFFMLIEAIRRKPVNRVIEGRIHMAGLFLLLALMLYITFHDIWTLF